MSKKHHAKGKTQPPSRSSLNQHHREGKLLHPPFQRLPGLTLTSWTQARFPDQLWMSLLVTQLDREFGIEILRTVAKACQGEFKPGVDLDLTFTGLAAMPEHLAERIIQLVCSAPGAQDALEPLLLFSDLPGLERWKPYLNSVVALDSWNGLAETVAKVLYHQSQAATDTRWARALFRVATGQMVLQTQGQFRQLAEYPYFADEKEAGGFIRISEMAENPARDYSERICWAESFWKQCLDRTPCGEFFIPAVKTPATATTRTRVFVVLEALAEAARVTASTTGRDARHAATFGLSAYVLGILVELLGIGIAQGILGRLGLRAILEAYITLSYLASKDDPLLWEGYRTYGQGQAKLALLKVDEFVAAPSFVTSELLDQVASEDKAPEYLSINLGHWANADLRKLSDTAGVKDAYDRIYPWTSAFVHSNWASVRVTTMATCGNPLHRLHAVLQPSSNVLDDVLEDACDLAEAMLTIVNQLYGTTLPSVAVPESA